jgi:arylsulfatase A-like enzyme
MSKRKPNILFIMSDDHASNAISCYGSRLAKDAPTVHLDRLGAGGVRMENCHCVNSICTPSRANILTGQHSHLNGVRTLSDSLPIHIPILPELLKEGGYETAIFGKWHLHTEPRGFDDWAILPGQGIYEDPLFVYPDRKSAPEGTILERSSEADFYEKGEMKEYAFGTMTRQKGYVTDIIADMTIDWLKERDGEKPFYVCCHNKAPHDFFEYKRIFEDIYKEVEFKEPDSLFEDKQTQTEISRRYGTTVSERWEPRNMVKHLQSEDNPNGGPVDFSGLDFEGRARKAYQKYMQDYLRTVHSIDENVGKILDYLDESGLADNTIVIYTSDQGMMLGEHDHIDKRWIFDESQRMPFLIRYPGGIKENSVNYEMVDNTDFAPTLLDFAELPIPETMQGRSFKPLLEGHTPGNWRQSVYYRYWMHMAHHWVPAHYGIRTDKYKLVFFYGLALDASGCDHDDCKIPTDPGFELYDLVKDPFENKNVYSDPAYAQVAVDLKKQLLELKETYGDTDEKYPELMKVRESVCF